MTAGWDDARDVDAFAERGPNEVVSVEDGLLPLSIAVACWRTELLFIIS